MNECPRSCNKIVHLRVEPLPLAALCQTMFVSMFSGQIDRMTDG